MTHPLTFYEREGDLLVPQSPAASPWNPRLQGGPALSGLLAHMLERMPSDAPMHPSRYSIDLFKPTPYQSFEVRRAPIRDGKRLQLLQAEVVCGGEVTARATLLRVRIAESPNAAPRHTLPGPMGCEDRPLRKGGPLESVLKSRLVRGGLNAPPGPGAIWACVEADIVRGEPVSPFANLAMAADFGSGISSVLDWRRHSYANVDISLHLARMPTEPWVFVEAETLSVGNGSGIVSSVLSDVHGELGRAHQTLFIEPQRRRN